MELLFENKENMMPTNFVDRFICLRNNSFDQEVNSLKMLDNTLTSESNADNQKVAYNGMLVSQLYRANEQEGFRNLTSARVKDSLSGDPSSSGSQVEKMICSQGTKAVEELSRVPGKIMTYVQRSNTMQLENQFAVQNDKELLNQVFTVKRCISL